MQSSAEREVQKQVSNERIRVLVVEDSPTLSKALTLMLSGNGLAPETAFNLSEALLRVHQPGIDVVLLDLTLPDSTGIGTFYALRAEARRIPVVILTGLNDETIAIECMHNGAQDYLIKGQASNHSIVRCLHYAFERSRVEQALLDSEHRLRMVIEHSLDAFVACDADGFIVDWNKKAEAMFGWKKMEALGEKMADLIIPERFRDKRNLTVEERKVRRQKYLNRRTELGAIHREGHEFPIEVAFFEIKDAGKETFCCFIEDITDRKLMEERKEKLNDELDRLVQEKTTELQRSNEELQQFAKIASHDLQEPLRAVEGFAKLLAKRYKGKLGKDGDEFIDFILDGMQRMQRLIQDVLAHSNIQVDRSHRPETNTLVVLKEVQANLAQLIDESSATFEVGELPMVAVERSKLVQLFQNIISNAIKYRKPNETPHIIISAERSVNEWVFSVRDNGLGFDSKYADKIFDMFARLHGKTEYSGTGMGLAICKKIVNANGGTIWAQSEVGHGSIFFFTLPAVDQLKEVNHAESD
jgi:PAS domain S-box-containing protein